MNTRESPAVFPQTALSNQNGLLLLKFIDSFPSLEPLDLSNINHHHRYHPTYAVILQSQR